MSHLTTDDGNEHRKDDMSETRHDQPSTATVQERPEDRTRRWRRLSVVVAAAMAGSLIGVTATAQAGGRHPKDNGYRVGQSARLEQLSGIRVKSVKLVGDSGIVELDYVVVDADKASRFQADALHPPTIGDDARKRGATVTRAALMKQGHQLRAGQTYYVLYQNTGNVVHAGDRTSVSYGGASLPNVPVE